MRGVAHFAYKFGPIRTQTQLTHTQHTQGGASFPSPPPLHLLGNMCFGQMRRDHTVGARFGEEDSPTPNGNDADDS